MRKVIHISDLHFGRLNHETVEPLLSSINSMQPDVVVVSGDLTQRAKRKEFQEAADFLDKISFPKIVVPGNHDVSLYNVFRRFLFPFERYKKYIHPELEPVFIDNEIAIVGLNTAHSLTFHGGRVRRSILNKISAELCSLDDSLIKIVVSHHPFDAPSRFGKYKLVRNANKAVKVLAESGADILLAGHLHVHHSDESSKRYSKNGRHVIVVQSGTTTSLRTRREMSSFNAIEVTSKEIVVKKYSWNQRDKDFVEEKISVFKNDNRSWRS